MLRPSQFDPASGAMGGGESVPRRVTFEADENDNITVVKGIRVRPGGDSPLSGRGRGSLLSDGGLGRLGSLVA